MIRWCSAMPLSSRQKVSLRCYLLIVSVRVKRSTGRSHRCSSVLKSLLILKRTSSQGLVSPP
ncbi:hypothetical protein LINPERPRIM_LOCUS32624 [Linum perenne]